MKLVRFGKRGHETPGIAMPDGKRLSLAEHFIDWGPDFFSQDGISQLAEILADPSALPGVADEGRWGASIGRPGKIVCIGLNYSNHARESVTPVPEEPILFLKASQTIAGPYDEVPIPRGSTKTDWEVELGVVVGRDVRQLNSEEEAASAIAGYCVSHDVSEHSFQLERSGQWNKGKSCNGFNPLVPWLVTPDEIPDPARLAMRLLCQWSRAPVWKYENHDLQPAEADSLHLPVHGARGRRPDFDGHAARSWHGTQTAQFLQSGDIVELGIAGLGAQRETFVSLERLGQ